MSAITEPDSKEHFLKLLKGKEIARDKFGTAIRIHDILVFGSGAKAGPDLYYGIVTKINYNGVDRRTGDEKVSSVGLLGCRENWSNPGTYKLTTRRISIRRWTNAWVITDNVPQPIKDAIEIGMKDIAQ